MEIIECVIWLRLGEVFDAHAQPTIAEKIIYKWLPSILSHIFSTLLPRCQLTSTSTSINNRLSVRMLAILFSSLAPCAEI